MNPIFKAIQEHSHLPVKFMYPNEGSDFDYTLGDIQSSNIEKIWIDDERVWILSQDEEELISYLEDSVYYDMFDGMNPYHMSDEQLDEMNKKAQQLFDEIPWEEVILIYLKVG